ncbi:hypothetical protein K435DRAFT_971480 [Dendrothele bispora CBS 962.96]|uniref:F-box domain-containing protein n=1 Tax=Dendrothele bispora (strain CBS 962.96) TaxID=1314807 RepID=A0A4S8L6C5_DENBC|nr:hypothetical protein K435DRAFT_971480 [Dendrothele bispora CBS 962.96]
MSSTPRPELHLDIVNLIIDELHGFRPDLKTCALVCRSWVSQSRLHLFSTICLSLRRLLGKDVSSFLALCASPYSTIPLARVSDFIVVAEIEELQNSAAFEQLLTWQSPHDGKSIADVFGHLKTVYLKRIEWRPLSQTAKSMLHLAFRTVTELTLRYVVFETGDEFLEFLSSLIGLEKLCLYGVSLREPGQASTMQSNVLSSHFHTIDLENLSPYHSFIRAITPCLSLKNLSVHVCNFDDMSADCLSALRDLLVSAGPSLESFEFCFEPWILETGVNLAASLQHIDFTKNSNLRKITLDVDDSNYFVPFLQRLTKSHYPPSLKKLHIPKLISSEMGGTLVDYKRVDELLQHSYFSALGEFRCRQCVIFGLEDVKGQPGVWYYRPNEGTQPLKEMESKIEELKSAMPKLADKGILQVDEHFELSSQDVWSRYILREGQIDED